MERSRSWGSLAFQALDGPAEQAGTLFRFAGAWAPPAPVKGWGAWDAGRLVGAALLERAGAAAMVHGPVVIAGAPDEPAPPDADPARSPLEIAAQLLADVLQFTATDRIDTVFARPQGLDRLWVRFGFVPIPEVELPSALRGRPGAGLFGWRGGTALWSAAGRGEPARAPRARR